MHKALTTIKSKLGRKQIAAIAAVFVLLLVGASYWRYSVLHPSTNDAYVKTDRVDVATQVAGRVSEVDVKDNQHVTKGELLFRIDPTLFEIALKKAQANLALTQQTISANAAKLAAAKANVAQAGAQFIYAAKQGKRILTLVSHGKASPSEGDDATSKISVAKANLEAAKNNVVAAQQALGAAGDANAQLQAAKAELAQAKYNLKHTAVYAPANGVTAEMNLRAGDMVGAGQSVFSVLEGQTWWVEANFKETDIGRIHPGQKVTINVDMYPDHDYQGIVESISRGTGSAFSLLPAENATGNWVKVTQRIPVRIKVLSPSDKYPLRMGASSSVIIDTTT